MCIACLSQTDHFSILFFCFELRVCLVVGTIFDCPLPLRAIFRETPRRWGVEVGRASSSGGSGSNCFSCTIPLFGEGRGWLGWGRGEVDWMRGATPSGIHYDGWNCSCCCCCWKCWRLLLVCTKVKLEGIAMESVSSSGEEWFSSNGISSSLTSVDECRGRMGPGGGEVACIKGGSSSSSDKASLIAPSEVSDNPSSSSETSLIHLRFSLPPCLIRDFFLALCARFLVFLLHLSASLPLCVLSIFPFLWKCI